MIVKPPGPTVVRKVVKKSSPHAGRYTVGRTSTTRAASLGGQNRLARLTPRARPARPGRVCGCAAQSAAPLPPTRALRRHTAGALWGRLADGTVGCVTCAR